VAKQSETFDLRLSADDRRRIFAAAEQLEVSASEVVRSGAVAYARQVLKSASRQEDT
jgi:uncharacterized protein (DUF1778 family)